MSWAAVVLAAGRSSRMGNAHKLLEDLHGKPLIRHVIDAALTASLSPVLLVTGYRGDEIAACARGADVARIANPDYAKGMMGSIQCGLAAVPDHCEGAVMLLGDMPMITADHIRTLLAALEARPDVVAAVPVCLQEWGHPVVLRRALFAEVMALSGDQGARSILKARKEQVIEVPIDDPSILLDLDTPEALARARGL